MYLSFFSHFIFEKHSKLIQKKLSLNKKKYLGLKVQTTIYENDNSLRNSQKFPLLISYKIMFTST